MSMNTATTSAFKPGDHIVYPAHGVGRVTGVEKQQVAGLDLEVYVISFEQDKMTLRVPTAKARTCGMRPLASSDIVNDAMKTLQGRARVKRTMWSRRAQEYEAKINSGDLVSIAEVVRDLHRGGDQPEQSYSERQLYESALDRMARELAAVEQINREDALAKLSKSLALKKAAA
jgi:CarD family transcriptional regulator